MYDIHDVKSRAFIVVAAGRSILEENFLYFANQRLLVHVNFNGSGVVVWRLANGSVALAVDFDFKYVIG